MQGCRRTQFAKQKGAQTSAMVSVSSQRSLASNGPHESPTIRCRRRTTRVSLAGTGRSSWHHDNPCTTSLPCSVVDNRQWNHGPSLKMENGWHDPRTILLQHKQYLTVAKSIRHIFQERGLHIIVNIVGLSISQWLPCPLASGPLS